MVKQRKKRFSDPLAILFCLYILFHLRYATAFLVSIFIFIYWFYSFKFRYLGLLMKQAMQIGITTALLVVVLVMLNISLLRTSKISLLQDFANVYEFYQDHSGEKAKGTSIGMMLKASDNLMVNLLGLIYTYLSPIPPLVFKDFNFQNAFMGLGNIMWYVIAMAFPLAVIRLRQGHKFSKLLIIVAVVLIFTLIVVYLTSGNSRHILFLHPLIVLFALVYIKRYKSEFMYASVFFFLMGMLLSVAYFVFKS